MDILESLPLCKNTLDIIISFIVPYKPKIFYEHIENYPHSPFCNKKHKTPYFTKLAQIAIKRGAKPGDIIVDNNNKYFSQHGSMFMVYKDPNIQLNANNPWIEHSFIFFRDTIDTILQYREFMCYPNIELFQLNKVCEKLDSSPIHCIKYITHEEIKVVQIFNKTFVDRFDDDNDDKLFWTVRIKINVGDKSLYLYEDANSFFPLEEEYISDNHDILLNKIKWILENTEYIFFRNWPKEYDDDNEQFFPFSGASYDTDLTGVKLDYKYSRNFINNIIRKNENYLVGIGSLFN